MSHSQPRLNPLSTRHGQVGLLLVIAGEALIMLRVRPISDFYFPFVWLGYTLVLDAALYAYSGRSLWMSERRMFGTFLALSVVFWWVFELFNVFVHNWVYVGARVYSGAAYVAFASLDFSLVLVAVWTSSRFVHALLTKSTRSGERREAEVPASILNGMMAMGVAALILPALWADYTFPLIWVSMYFLLDPINTRAGRPSMIAAVWNGNWRLPISFALGSLLCGFFWESWNYWSLPKWEYTIPFVNFWHVFEMPLLGYAGYLPFGLELFAMTNFALLTLRVPAPRDESVVADETSRFADHAHAHPRDPLRAHEYVPPA